VRLFFLLAATLAPAFAAGEYVKPQLCAGCHAEIWKTYRQNGMGRSLRKPGPEITIEDYVSGNKYYHPASDTWYEMLHRGGKYIQRRYQIGYDGQPSNISEKTIDYIFGSGNHMRTYVHRNPDGTLVELPLAWYAEKGGVWAMNPGYDSADYPYERRYIGYDCMFCHNAYPKTPAGHDRLGDLAVYEEPLPEGIDCQRCHGPGSRHVEVAGTPGAGIAAIRASIVNPARLSADRQLEVCAQCHLKTTEFRLPHAIKRYERGDFSYRPGEPLASFVLNFDEAPGPKKETRFETASAITRMRESACFLKSGGRLTCTTCHNPHDIPLREKAAQHYDAVCRSCHTTAFTALVQAGRHTDAANCATCHMPKRRAEDIVHMVMTDHRIQRRPPAGELLAELPEHHEDDHTAYHGRVAPYYPDPLPRTSENNFYLALAQVRDKSNVETGMQQLQRAMALWRSPRSEPYYELAEALRAQHRSTEAVKEYREALRRDPNYVPALLSLSLALRDSGNLKAAIDTARAATAAAPNDARGWNQTGQLLIDLGDPTGAAAALRHALSLDAEMPQAHNGLGAAFAGSGDPAHADAEFREAIRVLPNYGEAHGNLATLLGWKRDFPQAAWEFERATRLVPDDAATRFNYASMLNTLHEFDKAATQAEVAVRLSPNMAEARDLLGTLLERRGDDAGALAQYQAAVRLRPDLAHAQLDLGAVLVRRGDRQQAEEHLKVAAQSGDPAIRQMAQQILEQRR
jgi:predicted CXXCH cytochrome family protein